MSGVNIDTLLPPVAPLRPAEPPVREAAAEKFAPTLRDAVEARGPQPEAAPPKSTSDPHSAPDQQSADDDLVDSDAEAEVATATDQEESEGEDDAAADEVEISEAATNAAGAQRQQVDASSGPHETALIALDATSAEDGGDNTGGEAAPDAQADAVDGETGKANSKAASPSAAANALGAAAAAGWGPPPFRAAMEYDEALGPPTPASPRRLPCRRIRTKSSPPSRQRESKRPAAASHHRAIT